MATAAAMHIFGAPATFIMAALIMVSTFGCNNGIVLSSVRVYQAMAKDGLFFNKMKDNNRFGGPGLRAVDTVYMGKCFVPFRQIRRPA